MGIVLTIIIGVHVCSLVFLVIYLKKLFRYARKYRMAESKYTLMFGWIQISHIAIAYALSVSVFVVVSTILINFAQ